MFRKELIILGSLALGVFLFVAGVASLAVRAVQRDGSLLARDTLPGLLTSGQAMRRMEQNWFMTHELLDIESPGTRENLIQKINDNSTEFIWRDYQLEIHNGEAEQLFRELIASRNRFLATRSRYFDLVRISDNTAAKQLFETELGQAFESYRRAAGAIFKSNAAEGRARAYRLIRRSRWAPYALAAFSVMVLFVGVMVGFKASLGAFIGAWKDNGQPASGKQ
jgi:hypothetical protein